jgi:hypothetical protein
MVLKVVYRIVNLAEVSVTTATKAHPNDVDATRQGHRALLNKNYNYNGIQMF